jgi:phosphoribosylamine--glycine ligase
MKALLVGGGAREHALAWKLLQDDPSLELICAPGNAGIAELADCIPVKATDVRGLSAFAERADIGLTVVGPEAPLAEGIVDAFRANGRPIFGPTKAAAEIETSKRFAKSLMASARVPTAVAQHYSDADEALRAASAMSTPLVIKASGLAAGKGVVIARSSEEVERAINMMLPAQDHKRLLDGDIGPNTGGMGAYAPVSIATDSVIDTVSDTVFEPVLTAMRKAGRPFTGLLYAGMMLTDDGPKVVEFNCRFGDPETEAILPLMDSSLLDLLMIVASGGSIADAPPLLWKRRFATTTVLAAHGYPDAVRNGDAIRLPPPPHNVHVFHGSTARDNASGELLTAGGRVLAITGTGETLAEASACSTGYAEKIVFEGKQFRRDIGKRDLERHAGAA